jgi:hypothetical protein
MERGDILAALSEFVAAVHSLRISADKRPNFYLNSALVKQNHLKMHSAGLVKKGNIENPSRERELPERW